MAGSASLNSLSLRLPQSPLTSGPHRRLPSLNPSFSTSQPLSFPSLTSQSNRASQAFIPRAATFDDEWGKESTPPGGDVAVAEPEEEVVLSEVGELKKKLKELLYGTDRGLSASSETRAEIVELITQLESKNPTPAPTEALALLNGKWILAYTSFSGLFPLLGSGRLPRLVKVEEISQTIDSEAFTVQNSLSFAGPLATTSVTTNAKFEIRSPKRVQIKFDEGIIGTPQLTDSIVIPDKFEFWGQNIDLSPFKGIFTSIQDAASSVAKTISEQPPLKIPITSSNAQSWLLTTYLDEELRISRSDGGSIFVLVKEDISVRNLNPTMRSYEREFASDMPQAAVAIPQDALVQSEIASSVLPQTAPISVGVSDEEIQQGSLSQVASSILPQVTPSVLSQSASISAGVFDEEMQQDSVSEVALPILSQAAPISAGVSDEEIQQGSLPQAAPPVLPQVALISAGVSDAEMQQGSLPQVTPPVLSQTAPTSAGVSDEEMQQSSLPQATPSIFP